PHARIALGEKDSVTTSAHRTRSCTTARAAGLPRSSEIPNFPALQLANRPELSGPSWLPRKGWRVRAVSTRVGDSIRTTVAPKSARIRVEAGPAITHMKSQILTSLSGSSFVI